MTITTKAGAGALAATLALSLPGVAQARGGDAGRGERDGAVPSRVATKLRAAERAVARAEVKAEDGDAAGAATALTSARSALASALKAAQKRIVAGGTTGAAAAGALTRTDHRIVTETASLLDGAGDTVSDAAVTTLDAALDNRDAVVAAIAALGADDKAGYARVLGHIGDDADDETENLTEALTDDTLTDAGKTGLQAALTQIAATKTAAAAQVTDSADDAGYGSGYDEPSAGGRGDCPGRGGRRPGAEATGSTSPGYDAGYGQA